MGAALSVSFAATSLGEGGTIPPALRATSLYTREALRRGGELLPAEREAQSLSQPCG